MNETRNIDDERENCYDDVPMPSTSVQQQRNEDDELFRLSNRRKSKGISYFYAFFE
jgi:hypothetical protein